MVLRLVWDRMETNWQEAANATSRAAMASLRLAALLEKNATRQLAPFGISFTEFETLCALRASPPPHALLPTALYAGLLISSGGLTKVLKSLEAAGLVERPRSAVDRRRRPIALTAKGATLCEQAMAAVQKADQAAFAASGLEERELEAMTQRLARVVDGFQAETGRGP